MWIKILSNIKGSVICADIYVSVIYIFIKQKGRPGWLSKEIMEDNRAEQKEALETLVGFNTRLVKNMKIIIKELSGQRLDDTNAFLEDITKAMNWEIQVMNGTMELLNEGKQRIDKEGFNTKIIALSDAINSKDDTKMAKAFEEVVPLFEKLGDAANEVIA